MYLRFLNFFKSVSMSKNSLMSLCAKLAEAGSNSTVSNSLSMLSGYYKMSRHSLTSINTKRVASNLHKHDRQSVTASVIRDVISMLHMYKYTPNNLFLSQDELTFILFTLCVT